ncbi:MAG: hypothetical protein NC184_02020 [Roseburia sp.]|nr:hypothetical protein [Roseburia sp.]
MRKRLLIGTAAVAVCLSAGIALIGCGGNGDCGENGNDGASADTVGSGVQSTASTLRFDSKYYTDMDGTAEERGYFTFSENGMGKYYYYYSYYDSYDKISEISNYTISFKYIFTNAEKTQVACFYDGVTYTAKDNQKDARTDWDRIFDVSEELLISEGMYGRYIAAINEDFQKQIPNYGVTAD